MPGRDLLPKPRLTSMNRRLLRGWPKARLVVGKANQYGPAHLSTAFARSCVETSSGKPRGPAAGLNLWLLRPLIGEAWYPTATRVRLEARRFVAKCSHVRHQDGVMRERLRLAQRGQYNQDLTHAFQLGSCGKAAARVLEEPPDAFRNRPFPSESRPSLVRDRSLTSRGRSRGFGDVWDCWFPR